MKKEKQLTALLLALVITVVLSACSTPQVEYKTEDVPVPSIGVNQNRGDSGADIEATEKEAYTGPTHTVTFYANDGSVLWIDTVPEGSAATPPKDPEMKYGTVFSRWDGDFTNVTEDRAIQPICETVDGKKNVFALSGAYGKTGDSIIVPFRLCGEVCLCGFDLTITYDPEKLQLEAVLNEDGDIIYNDETPGMIVINFVNVRDVEADVDICCFNFKVLAGDGEVPINVEMTSIYAGNEDDSMYVPEYQVLPAMIYVYR